MFLKQTQTLTVSGESDVRCFKKIIFHVCYRVFLGRVSPMTVNFNRRFSPHFNLQLA